MANLSKALGEPDSGATVDRGSSPVMRVLALLAEALAACDELDLSPEVGARLEDLIDRLEEERGDREFAEALVRTFSSGGTTGSLAPR